MSMKTCRPQCRRRIRRATNSYGYLQSSMRYDLPPSLMIPVEMAVLERQVRLKLKLDWRQRSELLRWVVLPVKLFRVRIYHVFSAHLL